MATPGENGGVEIVRPPTATRVTGLTERPRIRKRYQDMKNVVNVAIEKLYREQQLLIFPTEWVQMTESCSLWAQKLHFSSISHIPQVGKEFGRVICDPSSHPDVELRLNGEDTRIACQEKYGKLELPTLGDIAVMISDARECRKRDHKHMLVLWKMDLRGAFALLNIRPTSHFLAGRLGLRPAGHVYPNLVYIHPLNKQHIVGNIYDG